MSAEYPERVWCRVDDTIPNYRPDAWSRFSLYGGQPYVRADLFERAVELLTEAASRHEDVLDATREFLAAHGPKSKEGSK